MNSIICCCVLHLGPAFPKLREHNCMLTDEHSRNNFACAITIFIFTNQMSSHLWLQIFDLKLICNCSHGTHENKYSAGMNTASLP